MIERSSHLIKKFRNIEQKLPFVSRRPARIEFETSGRERVGSLFNQAPALKPGNHPI